MTDKDDELKRAYLDAKDQSALESVKMSIANWREINPLNNVAVFIINIITVLAGAVLAYHYPANVFVLVVAAMLAIAGVYGIIDGPVRRALA